MKKSTSEIIEIVSAIAVVVSLVFVGVEIKNSSKQTEQNTQALQIAAYQDLIGRIVEINSIGIEASATIESLASSNSRTSQEDEKLNAFLWMIFRHGDMAFFQFESNAISEERMRSAMAPLLFRLNNPNVVERWKQINMVFVPSYRNYINNQIDLIQSEE